MLNRKISKLIIGLGLVVTTIVAGANASEAASCPAGAPVELDIGVQNVKMLPGAVKPGHGPNKYWERILAFRAFAQGRDVVAFNEVFINTPGFDSHWKPFKRELDKHFRYYARSYPTNNGLVIASKHPILSFDRDADKLVFSEKSGPTTKTRDFWVDKGAIHARIRHPQAGIISVFTTHLQAGERPKDREIRVTQLKELERFIDERSTGSDGVIVMGDINIPRHIRPAADEYDTFAEVFGMYAQGKQMVGRFRDHGNTNVQKGRLDYILTSRFAEAEFKEPMNVRMIRWSTASTKFDGYSNNHWAKGFRMEVSDHPALFGVLCVPRKPAPKATPQVTFYEHCGFKGRSINIPNGRHSLSALQALGVKNDDVSSIHVYPGNVVAIYEHTKFGGKELTLRSSVDCLNTRKRKWFNDKLSSAIVWRE